MQLRRKILYSALVALFLLRIDLWLWDASDLVFGLPVGLAYHVAFCLVTFLILSLLVRFAWPEHLQDPDERQRR